MEGITFAWSFPLCNCSYSCGSGGGELWQCHHAANTMGAELLCLARQHFLLGLAAIYVAAFASFYDQVPGLYGKDGILLAWKMLRFTSKGFWEQQWDSPILLWLWACLGLDTKQGMWLLCLLEVLFYFRALVLEPLVGQPGLPCPLGPLPPTLPGTNG
ncbi:hypothetical protein JRQ81_014528 [Phrynocephalus forsythii]|uniref:Uncharacterized protein n=1 Tax=Phrynocephalus forsythii TaxID=171643 RepID=A0A9Q0XZI0_9SAUR|nr:hypothetical protein JRQ81_014528 [Phrynocephalus forsythii]